MRRILFVAALLLMASAAMAQCGPQGCPQPSQAQATQQREVPSNAVVQIVSRRGNDGLNGTGSIVAIDGGMVTVLSCAHVLRDGYAPAIRYADGQVVAAEIVSV
ncbi:MAG: hypothetical protein WC655_29765, partial [Candidatus Hydrogenedentales bacterium]